MLLLAAAAFRIEQSSSPTFPALVHHPRSIAPGARSLGSYLARGKWVEGKQSLLESVPSRASGVYPTASPAPITMCSKQCSSNWLLLNGYNG